MKKTSRTFKRFAAITSASLLAACMVAPMASFAATDLTMTAPTLPENAEIKETVSAYKVFELSPVLDADNNPIDGQYNITSWGTGVKASNLITAITTNDTDFQIGEEGAKTNAFKGITYSTTDPDASAKLVGAALAKLDSTQVEAFAKTVMNNLDNVTVTGTFADDKVTFTSIDDGYYIMSCTAKSGDTDPYESVSLGMLTVVDDAIVNPEIGNGDAKVGLPTVQKKVEENQNANFAETVAKHETTDTSWNDVADYNIGDAVSFKLYGTMPDNLEKYDAYFYKFTDKLGTEFDKPTYLTINIDNEGTEKDLEITATYSDGAWSSTGEGVTVNNTLDGFTVEFADIKGNQNADKTTLVTIEYDAILNATAVVGKPGQNNAVNLTYSNNPNKEGVGTTETTPDDTVKVYTYGIKLDKEFYNAAGGKLTTEEAEDIFGSAKFSLSKDGSKLYFVESEDANFDYVLSKSGADGASQDLYLSQVGDNFVIRIKGLDEGEYTLTEENAPENYNIAPSQTITIAADTVNDQTWNGTETDVTLESFKWTIGSKTIYQGKDDTGAITADDEENGKYKNIDAIAKATMENRKGTSLPSTGGIGTTVFYLGGGAMVAVAGIYLISKKRMKNTQE